jgi:protein-S-isoprenylcysteine O-methyltransferase Ste14
MSELASAQLPRWAPGLAAVLNLAALAVVGLVAMSRAWHPGLAYFAIMVVVFGVNLLSVARWNPVLIKRRIGYKPGTKGWDWIVMLVGFTPGMLGMFVAAWWQNDASGLAPMGAVWWLALLILAAGWSFANWSMIVNPFFEKTVRIQAEHDHQVIDTGPYAIVRHPGYVGFLAWILTTPVLLGSSWAWPPAILAAGALLVRTWLEDRTLQDELSGYAEYAERVPSRLIPGVW